MRPAATVRGFRRPAVTGTGKRKAKDLEVNIGVDTLGVRRRLAAPRYEYARGDISMARAMVRDAGHRARGKLALRTDAFSPSSWRTRRSRELTLRRIARAAQFELFPITLDNFHTVAAALKEGRYRSAAGYLGNL